LQEAQVVAGEWRVVKRLWYEVGGAGWPASKCVRQVWRRHLPATQDLSFLLCGC
jgi:hypothetical protein